MVFGVEYNLFALAILFHLGFQFFRLKKNGISTFLIKKIGYSDANIPQKVFTIGFIIQQIILVVGFLYGSNTLPFLSEENLHTILVRSILLGIFGEIFEYYKRLAPFRESFCYMFLKGLGITLSLYIIGYSLFVL